MASSEREPRDDGVARNTAYALAAQLTTAAMTAVLTIYLIRALGPAGYGVFALALAFGSTLLLVSDMGLSQSTARFIAERRRDEGQLAEVIKSGLRLKLTTGLVISIAIALAAGPIAAAYGAPELTWPLRVMAVALFGQSAFLFAHTSFIALRRLSVSFKLIASESAVELGATLALVMGAGGATAAVAGRAVGYAFGAIAGVWAITLVARRARARSAGTVARVPGRALLGYAGALVIVDGAYALFSQIGVLLVGAILGPASAGLFAAPLRLLTPIGYLGLAVAQSVAPRLADDGGQGPDVRAFARALRGLVLAYGVILVAIVALAGPIAELVLGPEFGESIDVIRILAPTVFLAGLAPLASLSLNYLGQARRRIPIVLCALLVDAALCLVLIPQIGIVGAAIAAGAGYTVYVGSHLWICASELGLRTRVPRPARGLLSSSGS